MIVRAFTAEDISPARAALTGCANFTEEEVPVAIDMITSGLAGDYQLLTVMNAESFAGYACIGQAPLTLHAWYLYWICMAGAAMGTKAAGELLTAIETSIRGRGGNRLVAETSGRDGYGRARAFYRKAGFHECGRIPDFYGDGDDCVIYCKALIA